MLYSLKFITASSYCEWADEDHTAVDISFTVSLPGATGVMAWDTQKYENRENPTLSDNGCKIQYTSEPTALTFTINPEDAVPACGVRVVGIKMLAPILNI